MNKTIIININGIVFHIEEDAYEILKNYMTDVKRHFIDSADSMEITTDIENRIAEMFNELLASDNKQVIATQDVQTVIGQMGTVEDFASAEEEGTKTASSGPAFTYHTENRRLFRDPDDHLAAGVCAGIANYFDMQAIWIRLAFAIAFCFFGTGFFLYIILWIVIPKAVTRADRMAMKGEKLDLQGFKRSFEDDLKTIQGSLNDLHTEAKPLIYKTRDFAGDFFDHLRAFIMGAGRIFVKIFGILIMLTCLGFTIALLVAVFTYFAYGRDNIAHIFPFSIVNREYNFPFIMGSVVVLALPLIGLMLLASRMVFDRATINKSVGFTLLTVWLVSICVVIYYSVKVAAEFRSGGTLSQTVAVTPAPDNTYYLKLNNVRLLSADDSARLDIKHSFAGRVILDDDNEFDEKDLNGPNRTVNLYIERSDVAQPVLVESFTSRGRDRVDALRNAQDITYQFTQKDNILNFDRRMRVTGNKPYRGQEVKLILKVPQDAKLIIDQNIDDILQNVDVWRCQDDNKLDRSTPATFTMTNGGLQCKIDSALIKKAQADTTNNAN